MTDSSQIYRISTSYSVYMPTVDTVSHVYVVHVGQNEIPLSLNPKYSWAT